MVIYHGTSNHIESKLSYKMIGKNGTSKGYGFYFTSSRREAELYAIKLCSSGYVYSAITNFNKELSLYKRQITNKQLTAFFTSIEPLILLNYGSIQEAVRNERDAESDSDIVNSVIQACGNVETVLTSLYKTLGYDYSVDPLENGTIHYVALVPEAYVLSVAYYHSILIENNRTKDILQSMRK